MELIKYLLSWVRLAVRHSLGKADTTTIVVVIIVGVLSWASHLLPENTEYAAPVEFVMTLNEWQIITGVLGFIILVRLILAPYWLYKEQKGLIEKLSGDIKQVSSENDIRLMEWRKEYREPHIAGVSKIPTTLRTMWALVESITEERKKKRVTTDKLLDVLVDLLVVDKNDPILHNSNYTNEERIKKVTKRLRVRMGLRKRNTVLEAEWRKRVTEGMDDHGIGLLLKKHPEFMELQRQLTEHGEPISKAKIYHRIYNFLEDLSALYSIQLLVFYGGTKKQLYLFPREMRDWLRRFEDNIERKMRGNFTQINEVLEDYSIGSDLKND